MQIHTSRFGPVSYEADDVMEFPEGLLGLPGCHRWILLADSEDSALGWLQSVEREDAALAIVSPRRFVPDYQLRVARSDLAPLGTADVASAQVVAILGHNGRTLTLNLKAPLVLNLADRLGCQVVHRGDMPFQHELESPSTPLRKTA